MSVYKISSKKSWEILSTTTLSNLHAIFIFDRYMWRHVSITQYDLKTAICHYKYTMSRHTLYDQPQSSGIYYFPDLVLFLVLLLL